MTDYVVNLPAFHVEADSIQEAAEQAIKTFIEYQSAQNVTVRQFGCNESMHFNINIPDGQVITDN